MALARPWMQAPGVDDRPLDAREPPIGEASQRVFHEASRRGKLWSWEAERLPAWERVDHKDGTLFRGWTNVKMTRKIWHDHVGGKKYSELRLWPSIHFSHGRPRLKTWVDNRHVSFAQVAAFCWYRTAEVGEELTWAEFLDGSFESHHLPDRALRTRADTVGAGWVQALTRKEHGVHHGRLEAAVTAQKRVLFLEAEERRAAQQERTARALVRAQRVVRERQPGVRLASVARRRGEAEERRGVVAEARSTGTQLLLSWDIDWGCVAGGGPAIAELEENPYLTHLFVEFEMGPKPFEYKRKRQALLAACSQAAYLQSQGAEPPPWLSYVGARLDAFGDH
jgi:hypothetical protein